MAQRVQEQILLSGTQTGVGELDPRLLEALRTVPRHRFVPEVLRPLAYRMQPLPVGEDQNIATPFLVALMTQLARPAAKDRVFETGTGAGYHAAILSRVVAEVYTKRLGIAAWYYQLLRSSRSLTKTVLGSGSSGRSGNASRRPAITLGLRRRRKVLISFSRARVVTMAWPGSWVLA